ncbi:MAG: precorrin-6y C5,15-methyltransferase (decarboxylating) subunit CbiE [Pseudomonadota bacterium]
MSANTNTWIDIIGIGEDGVAGLSPAALAALERAETVIGGDRHHSLTQGLKAQRIAWPHPFDALIDTIRAHKPRPLAILATGDPLWFSVGARILREIPAAEVTVHPQLSAFQWAAARMGWSLADIETVTAHGRPAAQVIPYFWPGARLLILTAGAETPGQIAQALSAAGYGASAMAVLGALGGAGESRHDGTANAWAEQDPAVGLPAFHTLAVHCQGAPATPLPRWGLPDDAFEHDGKLTKLPIRSLTLARLMPARGEVLWDIGVGCGSVAIEWMRAASDAIAVGFDPKPDRLATARQNANRLGAPRLTLIDGAAPEALDTVPAPKGTQADLRRPDAVFIGGGLSEAVFQRAWDALPPGGRLVANAVTLESEAVLLTLHARHGGTLMRLATQTASPVGGMTGWRPAMPVTQWALIK